MGKFLHRGVLKVWYTPTLASQSTPSIAAVDTAGIDLTPRIAEMSGFTYSSSAVATPTLDTTLDLTIAGIQTVEDSSLTIYDDDGASDDIRTALSTLNTSGFLLFARYGWVAAEKAEVWPVRTGSYSDPKTLDNEAAKSMIQFYVTAAPTLSATLAA